MAEERKEQERAPEERRVVRLANQTRMVQVLNLPAHLVPELSTRGRVATTVHDTAVRSEGGRRVRGGERSVRTRTTRIAGSITLQPKGYPGDIVRDLPPSILLAPEVQRALNAWPPKIAASEITIHVREEERTVEAAAVEAQQKAAAQHALLLEEKTRTRAKNAGADVDDTADKTRKGGKKE